MERDALGHALLLDRIERARELPVALRLAAIPARIEGVDDVVGDGLVESVQYWLVIQGGDLVNVERCAGSERNDGLYIEGSFLCASAGKGRGAAVDCDALRGWTRARNAKIRKVSGEVAVEEVAGHVNSGRAARSPSAL